MNMNHALHALACAAIIIAFGSVRSEAGSPPESSPEAALQQTFEKFIGTNSEPEVQIFREYGQDALAFLARKVEAKDLTSRVKAVAMLRDMGRPFTDSETGIATLCAALKQPEPYLRSMAAVVLGNLGPKAKGAVPALTQSVEAGTNVNGILALGKIGPEAKAALPVLESKVRERSGLERLCAAGAVLKIGGSSAEAETVIQAALANPDWHIRSMATNVVRSLELRLR
jgi:HEAT repeat protein